METTTMTSSASCDVPFTPECEVLYEDGPSSLQLMADCKKNPGHKDYISVSQLTIDDLPLEYQSKKLLDCIKIECDLTVKIVAPYTSPKRPDTYHNSTVPYPHSKFKGLDTVTKSGTGSLFTFSPDSCYTDKPCPCHICCQADDHVVGHWEFEVVTAIHVVYDNLEAARVIFECFYDSDSSEGKNQVKLLYGICLTADDPGNLKRDRCMVKCVSHDKELGEKLCDVFRRRGPLGQRQRLSSIGFMISHPHGLAKTITFGRHLHYFLAIDTDNHRPRPHAFKQEIKCRLTVPENTQQNREESQYPNHYVINNETVHMTPGTEYPLPIGFAFTFLPNTKHVFRFDTDNACWYTFPPETIFSFPGVNDDSVFFPPHAEFGPMDASHFLTLSNVYNDTYVAYDIHTCPGSSGAAVHDLHEEFQHRFPAHTHAGAIPNGNANRSGLGCLMVARQF